MKVKSVQLVSLVADIIEKEMRVGVSLRVLDQQEKITEVEESDRVATSLWKLMSSGKKSKGNKEGKVGSVKQLSENQVGMVKCKSNTSYTAYFARVRKFWS